MPRRCRFKTLKGCLISLPVGSCSAERARLSLVGSIPSHSNLALNGPALLQSGALNSICIIFDKTIADGQFAFEFSMSLHARAETV